MKDVVIAKMLWAQVADWMKRGIVLGIFLASVWLMVRHGFALWRYAPHGHASIWRFVAVTFALWFAPGLWWLRWGVKTCSSWMDGLLIVLVGSVATSGLLIWLLYFFGLYSVVAAWGVVVVLIALGLACCPWSRVVKAPVFVCRSLESLSWVELAAFSFIALFGVTMWIQSTGMPLTSWDAIVSWDKWACDMAERQGLGRYLMGGYPQLLPSLCSVSYKLAGSWGASFPDEQLLMHGYAAPFAIILILAVIRLCRVLEAPWAPCILISISMGSLQAWWISGYVDVPATALIIAATVLLTSILRGTLIMRSRLVTALWIGVVLFAVGFAKGYGLIWVLLIPCLAMATAHRDRSQFFAGWKLLAAGVGMAVILLSSFYGHQRFFASHLDLAATNARLHTFTVDVNKSALYDRSWALARERVLGELDGMGRARDVQKALLPRGVQRVVIGLGVIAGCLPGGAPVIAGAMILQWWVWEKTTAYDARNLLPAMVLLCILFSLGWKRLGSRMGWVGAGCGVVVSLVIAWPWLVQESVEIVGCMNDAGSRERVSIWSKQPEMRLRSVAAHQFFVRVIAEQSPLGKRAHYIYAPDEFYRHLGQRGVYTLKGNVFTEVQQGDLLICNKNDPEPPAFTPVANLRLPGYVKLLCCRPVWRAASWSAGQSEGVSIVAEPGGMVITGDGWLSLKIDPLMNAKLRGFDYSCDPIQVAC